MTKPSIFRYEGHNYLVPFLIISSLFFMWGFAHGILEVLNPHFQESFVSIQPLFWRFEQ